MDHLNAFLGIRCDRAPAVEGAVVHRLLDDGPVNSREKPAPFVIAPAAPTAISKEILMPNKKAATEAHQSAVLKILNTVGEPFSCRQIQAAATEELTLYEVRYACVRLQKRGLIEPHGKGCASKWAPVDVSTKSGLQARNGAGEMKIDAVTAKLLRKAGKARGKGSAKAAKVTPPPRLSCRTHSVARSRTMARSCSCTKGLPRSRSSRNTFQSSALFWSTSVR